MGALVFDAQPGCSLLNASACAQAAVLAYSDESAIDAGARALGFDRVRPFRRSANYAAVLVREDVIVVAFRGTDDWGDWLTNLNVLFKKSPLGYVHRGFMKATESFWPELAGYVREARTRDQAVWVTGHSLGGALAVLTSIKLYLEEAIPIAGLYTFGQPPVGTTGFGSRFTERCSFGLYRFVNHTDAVSDVPILGREHMGTVRYFDVSGKLWEGTPPFKVALMDHVRAPHLHGGRSQFLAHSIAKYAELIAGELTGQSPRG